MKHSSVCIVLPVITQIRIWIHSCNPQRPRHRTHPYTTPLFFGDSRTFAELFSVLIYFNWELFLWMIISLVIPYPTFRQVVTLSKCKPFCPCWMYCAAFWKPVHGLWQPLLFKSQFNPLGVENSRKTNKQIQKPSYQLIKLNWSRESKKCQSQTRARTFCSQEQREGSEIMLSSSIKLLCQLSRKHKL